MAVVVTVITYASLIIGELVPKQIALRDPESVAVRVAPTMALLAKVSSPLVWLLDRSGKTILWALGHRGHIGKSKRGCNGLGKQGYEVSSSRPTLRSIPAILAARGSTCAES